MFVSDLQRQARKEFVEYVRLYEPPASDADAGARKLREDWIAYERKQKAEAEPQQQAGQARQEETQAEAKRKAEEPPNKRPQEVQAIAQQQQKAATQSVRRGRTKKPLNDFAARLAKDNPDISTAEAQSEIKSRIIQDRPEQKRKLGKLDGQEERQLESAMRAFRRVREKK